MVVLLNGSFGIGKTTVARILTKRLPGTVLFDPELIGFVLQRARKLAGRPVDDFQDIPLWRRLVILGIRIMTRLRRNVIVPMAFSNRSYLEEVRSGIARYEPDVRHVCLVAPEQVVYERLARRGGGSTEADLAWQYRRAAECCVAHRDAAFAEHISTDGITAAEVAERLLASFARGH